MMIDKKVFKQRIDEILALCRIVNTAPGGFHSDEYRAADNKFHEAIKALDRDAASGLTSKDDICVSGRFVKFGVNDGYARYIILQPYKRVIKLIHIPYADAYHSPNVNDGEADRGIVEDNIRWFDSVREAIEKVHRPAAPTAAEHSIAMARPVLPVVEAEFDIDELALNM